MGHKFVKKGILATGIMMLAFLNGCTGQSEEYLEQADKYLQKGQYEQALDNYNKAIMEDEELQSAYRGAGIAYIELEEYEKAEDMLLRGLKESEGTIDEEEVDASFYLGEARMRLKKYEEAIETYSNIIEYDGERTEAYMYRGAAYLFTEKEEKADKDFKRVRTHGDISMLYYISEAYAQMGKNEESSAYLEVIINRKESERDNKFVKGRAYQKLGKIEEAIKIYETYRTEHGLTMSEYRLYRDCLMEIKDYDKVVELNQSLRENAGEKDMQELMFDEIVIYEKKCDYANAYKAAEEYVSMYPEDEAGQKEYQFLQSR